MRDKKDNVIVTKTFGFACEIVDLEEKLVELKKFVLSKQVAGSGMSIGANVREAQRAVSKADFINKLGIALKEAEETEYWFDIIEKKVFPLEAKLKNELQEIISILVSIINSSKNNRN
jgi:four helix bundle protein